MGILRTGLDAVITLYQVIVHLVLIVLGGAYGIVASMIILIAFGNKAANDFIDRYMDVLLTIGGSYTEKEDEQTYPRR